MKPRCAPHLAACGVALVVTLSVAFAAPLAGAAPAIGPTPTAAPSGSVGVPGAAGAPGAPSSKPAARDQAIRVDAVHIEGKLYSPQALFIVSRPAERFGRDAIVPQYLEIGPAATALPYRLRADVLQAAPGSVIQPEARRAD